MATTYTRTTLGQVTNLTATAAAGGSLTASTQFWFTVIPLSGTYLYSIQNACGTPATIATASTTVTDKTINLAWDATAGAAGYMVYWTKVDPGTDPCAFNSTGYNIRASSGLYHCSVTTNSFSFTTEATSGSPNYSVSYADAYRYLAIFNQKCDYLLLQNVAETVTPATLYAACVANSWDSINQLDDYAYDFKANIYVASIAAVIDFRGTSVQSIGGLECYVTSSMFKAGYTDISSIEDGGSWVNLGGQGVAWWNFFHFHDVRIHGFSYRNIRKGYKRITTSRYSFMSIAGDDWQISNCNISGAAYLTFPGGAIAGSYIKDTNIQYSRWGLNITSDISLAEINNVLMIGAVIPLYTQKTVYASNLKEDYSQTNLVLAINTSDATETKATLTDCEFDLTGATAVIWYNAGRQATGNEYIKNVKTQTFHITDVAGNNLSGVPIVIEDNLGVTHNATTDANGAATITPIIGIHRSNDTTATNNGYYTDYNPFRFVIEKAGFETEDYSIEVTDTAHHIKSLKTQITKLEDDNGNVFDRVDKTNSGTTNLRRKLTKVM